MGTDWKRICELAGKSEITRVDVQKALFILMKTGLSDFVNLVNGLSVGNAEKIRIKLFAALVMRYACARSIPKKPTTTTKPPKPTPPVGQDYLNVIARIVKPEFIDDIDEMLALGYSFDAFLEELAGAIRRGDSGFVQAKAPEKVIRMMRALTVGDAKSAYEYTIGIALNLVASPSHLFTTEDCRNILLGATSVPRPHIVYYHTPGYDRGTASTQVPLVFTMLRILNLAEVTKTASCGKYTVKLKDNRIVDRPKDVFGLPGGSAP
jgi:hypothetical protein